MDVSIYFIGDFTQRRCSLLLKVAGETETKAQIKLRFKTAAGKDVVCIRSFQLTQKAKKMEYKAIDSVLQTINPHTGEVAHDSCYYSFTL